LTTITVRGQKAKGELQGFTNFPYRGVSCVLRKIKEIAMEDCSDHHGILAHDDIEMALSRTSSGSSCQQDRKGQSLDSSDGEPGTDATDSSTASDSNEGKSAKRRRGQVSRTMLTPTLAREIYMKRPALDEVRSQIASQARGSTSPLSQQPRYCIFSPQCSVALFLYRPSLIRPVFFSSV
jgi:hypothetical protein